MKARKTQARHTRPRLTPEVEAAVIEYYLSHKENTAPTLAEIFKISANQVNGIITRYFNSL